MAPSYGQEVGSSARAEGLGFGSFPGLSLWPGLSHRFQGGGGCKRECSKRESGGSCRLGINIAPVPAHSIF